MKTYSVNLNPHHKEVEEVVVKYVTYQRLEYTIEEQAKRIEMLESKCDALTIKDGHYKARVNKLKDDMNALRKGNVYSE